MRFCVRTNIWRLTKRRCAILRILYKRFICDIRRLCSADKLSREEVDSLFADHYEQLQSFLVNYSGERMSSEYTANVVFPKRFVEYSPAVPDGNAGAEY